MAARLLNACEQGDLDTIRRLLSAPLDAADAADAAALALCHLAMSPALSGANARISRRVAS